MLTSQQKAKSGNNKINNTYTYVHTYEYTGAHTKPCQHNAWHIGMNNNNAFTQLFQFLVLVFVILCCCCCLLFFFDCSVVSLLHSFVSDSTAIKFYYAHIEFIVYTLQRNACYCACVCLYAALLQTLYARADDSKRSSMPLATLHIRKQCIFKFSCLPLYVCVCVFVSMKMTSI